MTGRARQETKALHKDENVRHPAVSLTVRQVTSKNILPSMNQVLNSNATNWSTKPTLSRYRNDSIQQMKLDQFRKGGKVPKVVCQVPHVNPPQMGVVIVILMGNG